MARLLEEHGHVAEHVTEIGPADAPDRDLWQYALDNDAVLVTRRAALLAWLEPLIDDIVDMVSVENRLIELR